MADLNEGQEPAELTAAGPASALLMPGHGQPTHRPAGAGRRRERGGGRPDGNRAPQAAPKDAVSPASKPQGILQDQVKTMESEGQAQPQEGDLTPEELDDPMAGSPNRNPGLDNPGQRPMTDNKAGG